MQLWLGLLIAVSMPSGVEHEIAGLRPWSRWRLIAVSMPSGVEHKAAVEAYCTHLA